MVTLFAELFVAVLPVQQLVIAGAVDVFLAAATLFGTAATTHDTNGAILFHGDLLLPVRILGRINRWVELVVSLHLNTPLVP